MADDDLQTPAMGLLTQPGRAQRLLAAFASLCGVLVAVPADSATCTGRSGPWTAALVELYTSEGCDSCPPADRWLSATFPPGAATRDVAVLAFHVDYWDRLGWKDRFAQPAFTTRQYDAMRANRAGFVYTPQVLVQGRDFSTWREVKGTPRLGAIHARPARADIMLEAEPTPNAITVKASARIAEGVGSKRAALFVAFTDSGLVSQVKAGENAGKRLAHDHVVRALSDRVRVNAAGEVVAELALPRPVEGGIAPTLVAFLQDTGSGDVLQAFALPCPAIRASGVN